MNEPHDPIGTKLDGLLRTWADEFAADSSEESDLLRAILTAASHCQAEFAPSRIVSISAAPSRGTWSVLAACMAVMILLAVSLAIPVAPRSTSPTAAGPSAVKPTATIETGTAIPAGLSKLWNRTTDVFGPQLNWLCDLDGELLLGVDSGAATIAEHNRAYVVLTVRARDTPSDRWSSIWTGRVVCPLGESVDFDSNKTHAGGTIWVQSRPNGRVVASHWLNWPDHPEISGSIDTEVAPGESRVVAEQIADGRSIQLVQQVWTPHAG